MSVESLYRINLTGAGRPVASLNTFTTSVIDMRTIDRIQALLIRVNAPGTPDIKVEYEITPDGVTWNNAADNPTIISSSATLFATKVDPKSWQSVEWPLDLSPSKQIRLKFSGINANPSSTVVDAKLLVKEKHG